MSVRSDALTSLTTEQKQYFDWLDASYLKRVIAALEAAEKNSVRFVGGCVRDSLLGYAPKDFDLATTLAPDAVLSALKKAGLGAAPTGIDHGTITAIADHKGVEVTTLRADVSTDGRRATVAFTQDWALDARRRDFRINAIYLTPDGWVFDPVGGRRDAAQKRVRFIGDADQRIREDYLRILRFFRFTARFSEGFDEDGLAACARLKEGVKQLSAERIGAELMGILSLPRAAFAVEAMCEIGVLKEIWPAAANIAAVSRLKGVDPQASGPLTLAALYDVDGDGVGARLRLANAEKAIRSGALRDVKKVTPGLTVRQAKALMYRLGKDLFTDAVALALAFAVIDERDYEGLRGLANDWSPPVFPLSGRDVLATGLEPGPEIAEALRKAENRWVDEDFPAAARAKAILAEIVK